MSAPVSPSQAPTPAIATGEIVQAVFGVHMDTAAEAGLLTETPLHRMASFLSSEPGKGYLFDVMGTNTASGDQNRLIVMGMEDRDGTPSFTTPLEEFRWTDSSSNDKGALKVSHTSHNPELGHFDPEHALKRLADILRAQMGMTPTELVFAED